MRGSQMLETSRHCTLKVLRQRCFHMIYKMPPDSLAVRFGHKHHCLSLSTTPSEADPGQTLSCISKRAAAASDEAPSAVGQK
jgi:hypothetical protein